MKTTKLYRPVNKVELDLIEQSGWTKFPPRLPEQPIFYPVTNQAYASQITTEWNVPAYNNGFVLEFKLSTSYLSKFKVEKVGLDHHTELWVPAEELEEFNLEIIGKIKVVEAYHANLAKTYVYVRDTFKIKEENVIGIEFINSQTNFVITENSAIGPYQLQKYLEQPRKLGNDSQIDVGYFTVILKSNYKINPIQKDKVYLMISKTNKNLN